jgi:hypothetical protein
MTNIDFIKEIDLTQAMPSWAELELKANIYGLEIDTDFCRYMLAFTRLYEPAIQVVAEGILSSIVWDCCKTNIQIIEDILQLYKKFFIRSIDDFRYAQNDILNIMYSIYKSKEYERSFDNKFSLYDFNMRLDNKYILLDAIERRFPLLPVKFYATNFKYIHSSDENLGIWIKKRLAKRAETSDIFRKIYKSMEAEFSNNHLTNAVFMN